MSFYVKIVKNRWWLRATPPDFFSLRQLRVSILDPRLCPLPPLLNPGGAISCLFV